MELQTINSAKPLSYLPPSDEDSEPELAPSTLEAQVVMAEREDFVKRIEAYCDCV